MLRGKPAAFLARGIFDVAISAIRRVPTAADFEDPRWPAHLHINVIPQVRGAGVGTALMLPEAASPIASRAYKSILGASILGADAAGVQSLTTRLQDHKL
jgi:hypothetical protein